jgi:hypothetical protein
MMAVTITPMLPMHPDAGRSMDVDQSGISRRSERGHYRPRVPIPPLQVTCLI